MKISAISFDFWNTIYHDHQYTYERHNERVKFFKDALIRSGYKQEFDIEGSFKYCWQFFDNIWKNEHRTLNARELLDVGCEYLNIKLLKAEFDKTSKFFEEILLKYPPQLFEGAKDIIPQLSKIFKLGITSDTAYSSGKTLRKLLERDNLLLHFSAFTFSDEIGCSKPDPIMFRNTMKGLDSKPHNTIHVGDNEYTDIRGASEEGLKTVLFRAGLQDKNKETEADYKVDDWMELKELLHFI